MSYAFRLLEKGRGIHFDEKVVDAFVQYYEREVLETESVEAENIIRMKWVS